MPILPVRPLLRAAHAAPPGYLRVCITCVGIKRVPAAPLESRRRLRGIERDDLSLLAGRQP